MAHRRWHLVALALALASPGFALAQAEQPPASARSKSSDPDGPATEKRVGDGPSLDALRLPSGAIVILCEQAKEALKLVPQAVILSPREYQKLLDKIDQLQRQAQTGKPETPSACRLRGRLEGDIAKIHLAFEFRTDHPKARVNLGCQRAWPTAATLDGKLPWSQFGEEGFVIQVDQPGAHQATLDVSVPILARRGAKGADRAFELDLPRAAIVVLEQFDLPAGIAEVYCGARAVQAKSLDTQRNRIADVPLTSSDYLDFSWKGPAAEPAKGPAVLTAIGRISARVNETHLFTEADLTLQVVRGETKEWRIAFPMPAGADLDIKFQPQDELRVLKTERSIQDQNVSLTIRLKEASADPLRVVLQIRQTRSGNTLPIGPFVVLGALSQKGEIEVRAPAELRLTYQVREGVSQRDVNDDQRRENVRAAFSYWNLSLPQGTPSPDAGLLTLRVETVKGAAETRVTHSLQLMQNEGEESGRWRAVTRIDVTPIRTAVDRFEVVLPVGYEYDKEVGASPTEIVEDVIINPQTRIAVIKLAQKVARPFTITLVGSYALRRGQHEAGLDLVQPTTWGLERGVQADPAFPDAVSQPVLVTEHVLDRGGQLTVLLPEGLELQTGDQGNNPAMLREALHTLFSPLRLRTGMHEYSWQTERVPVHVDLGWRPQQADLTAGAVIDIALAGARARVRHRLDLHFGQLPPAEIVLHLPAEIQDRVRVVEGGVLAGQMNPTGGWSVKLVGSAGKDPHLTLEYSFDLPQPGSAGGADDVRFPVPLVQLSPVGTGEVRVRIWNDPGVRASVASGSWEELATEVVADRDTLPTLVLRGNAGSSLSLSLHTSSTPVAGAVVDRVLVRAAVTDAGYHNYRVRYLLSKLNARTLRIALPVMLFGPDLDVRLGGKWLPTQFVDAGGRPLDAGKIVQLAVEPELYTKPVVLELRYRLGPGRMESKGLFQAPFEAPALQGALLLGRTRWLLELPAEWVPVYMRGPFTLEQQWGWRGRLWAPQPSVSGSELTSWLDEKERLAPSEEGEPSLVCWQADPGPLALVYFPQRSWLLVCSLSLIGLGLGLFFVPLPRLVFWTVLLVGILAAGVTSLLWPGVLSVIFYGCEPGAVILLAVVGVHGILHWWQRRKTLHMPGFTRLKTESSLIRGTPSDRQRPAPTIDEAPKLIASGSSDRASARPGQASVGSAPRDM